MLNGLPKVTGWDVNPGRWHLPAALHWLPLRTPASVRTNQETASADRSDSAWKVSRKNTSISPFQPLAMAAVGQTKGQ